jgi:WD40 repeat protein
VSIRFSLDGHLLATLDQQGTATLWDIEDSNRPRRRADLPTAGTYTVEFNPDGRTLASFSGTRGQLWDISDPNKPRKGAVFDTGAVADAAFGPDGRLLATVGDRESDEVSGETALWDTHDVGQPRRAAILDIGDAASVVFSPDRRTLATVGYSELITSAVVFDISDARKPRRTATLAPGDVGSLAFSPDGLTVATATGAADNTAVLWDVHNHDKPRRFATLSGHAEPVDWVGYVAGGRLLATADGSTVRLWHFVPAAGIAADPVGEACRIAGGGFTRDQWREFVPGLPFQATCTP